MPEPLPDDPQRTIKRDPNQPTPSSGVVPPPAIDPTRLPAAPGYDVRAEIARGGMGLVLSARESALDREVAIKTFRADRPALVADTRRFEREMRITARLSHPGVPPVYGRGTLADGRPFLAMKLVAGQTLARLLRDRAGPNADLMRFVDVFEKVCDAVGYAHSQRVIHRDLKPSNVMVGAFGEVHVMDWGLAKVVFPSGEPDPEADELESTVDLHPIEGDDTPSQHLTRRGQIVGTPAFMAPEQARGEVFAVDARADVFALGGILCVVLTGHPPFGSGSDAALFAARAGAVGDALARLDTCGADAELVALAKRCLNPEPSGRPADGKAVADAVTAYRAGVERRLRQAEAERAAADARATEESNTRREAEARLREQRRKRRWQLLTAAALALLVVGAVGFAWWSDVQARERRDKADRSRETVLAGLKQADQLRAAYQYDDADTLLVTLRGQAESDAPDLAPDVDRARENLAFARELDVIRIRKWLWVSGLGSTGRFNTDSTAQEYASAIQRRGFEFAGGSPTELAEKVKASPLRTELLAALDDWALFERDAARRERVLEVARLADPDPWLDRFRNPRVRADRDLLELLVRDDKSLTPAVVVSLSQLLGERGLDPLPLLEQAALRYPADFSVPFTLGLFYMRFDPNRALGYFRAALAIRPNHPVVLSNIGAMLADLKQYPNAVLVLQSAVRADPNIAVTRYNLSDAYLNLKRYDDAIREARAAIRLDPLFPHPHNTLGRAYLETGKLSEAVAEYRAAIRIAPRFAAIHFNLAEALADQTKYKEALAEYRAALKLDPNLYLAHYNLGVVLRDTGDAAGARDAFRAAIKADPRTVEARVNLANLLLAEAKPAEAMEVFRDALAIQPDSAIARNGVGLAWQALAVRGKVVESAAARANALLAFRRAAELDPAWPDPLNNAGVVYTELDDPTRAEAAYRAALRRNADYADAHNGLGTVLGLTDLAAALEEYRIAARLNPRHPHAPFNVAIALYRLGRFEEAVPAFDTGIVARPGDVRLYLGKGLALRDLGRFAEAIATFKEGQKVADKPETKFSLMASIRQAEHLVAFAARAADILAGKEKVKDVREWVKVAEFIAQYQRRYADALRAYQEAFKMNPAVAGDPNNRARMNAAALAALAAFGAGAEPPPANERAKYRRWAYEHLRDDLTVLAGGNRTNVPGAGPFTHTMLSLWLVEPAFARLRHPLYLATLPPAEATRWVNFWKQVRAWRDKTAPTISPPREVSQPAP